MPNEMIRPCTLWGETFDACDVKAVNDYLTFEEESASPSMGYNCGVNVRNDPFRGDIASPTYKIKSESYQAIIEAITTIAEALNAPVLAKDEVLAGLPKDAKAFVVLSTGNMCKMTWAKDCWEIRDGDYYMEVEPEDSFRIIADKADPKTAEYLRQFTLDGVRIKEGG